MNEQITQDDLSCPLLTESAAFELLTIANAVDSGSVTAHVSLTYRCQTDGKRRLPGRDYRRLPGVAAENFTGPISVWRRVDNAINRKLRRVGRIYFKVRSVTRANGTEPYGPTNIRPEGIIEFVVTGVEPKPFATEGAK